MISNRGYKRSWHRAYMKEHANRLDDKYLKDLAKGLLVWGGCVLFLASTCFLFWATLLSIMRS